MRSEPARYDCWLQETTQCSLGTKMMLQLSAVADLTLKPGCRWSLWLQRHQEPLHAAMRKEPGLSSQHASLSKAEHVSC